MRKRERRLIMEKEVLDYVIERTHELMNASSCLLYTSYDMYAQGGVTYTPFTNA